MLVGIKLTKRRYLIRILFIITSVVLENMFWRNECLHGVEILQGSGGAPNSESRINVYISKILQVKRIHLQCLQENNISRIWFKFHYSQKFSQLFVKFKIIVLGQGAEKVSKLRKILWKFIQYLYSKFYVLRTSLNFLAFSCISLI